MYSWGAEPREGNLQHNPIPPTTRTIAAAIWLHGGAEWMDEELGLFMEGSGSLAACLKLSKRPLPDPPIKCRLFLPRCLARKD